MKKTITYPIFVFCTLFSFTFLQTGWGQSWVLQNSNEDHPIMCVDAVDENIVWAGGWEGSIIRTLDGGENWSSITVPDTESFDFYSIAAINADTAYFAGSAFNSIDARVYKTTDGGANWELQYQNTQPEAFFNSIAFYDASNGIAISDQINGGFLIITTDDGGATWTEVPAANIPPAFPGEFSGFGDGGGTCLTLYGDSTAWFGTAYGTASNDSTRVFKSTDRGQNWTAVNTPYSVGAQFRGLSTIAFKDSLNGFAAGSDGIISTTDGGQSWSMVTSFDPPNFGVGTLVIVPETDGQVLMVSTQEGTYYSEDGGGSWMNFGSGIFVGLSFVNPTTGWAANFFEPGQGGLI